MFKHPRCEAHRTRSAVEVQHGSSPQAFHAKPAEPDQPLGFSMVSGIFTAKPTGTNQPLRFRMALPLRPYHPQRFILQEQHANPTRIFKHLQCEAHRTSSAVEVQHGSSPQAISPAALHPSEASHKSDKNVQASSMQSPPDQISLEVQHGSSPQAFNAKPAGPDQPLRFSMVFRFRPYHLQRFLHQKLHSNLTKMFRHLHCEAHRTRSAVEVQHGSSPQAFNAKPTGPDQPLRFSMVFRFRPYHPQRFVHQKLHANRTKVFRHLHCEAHRTRSAVAVQHGSSPQAFNAKLAGPDLPLRFSMVFPLRPYITCSALSIRDFSQYGQKCSGIFTAKPTGPDQPLRFR